MNTENYKLKTNTGFSVIEMVITMGIFIFVIGFSFGIGLDTYGRSDLGTERDMLVSLLYKARSRAINNINESAHGLYIDAPNSKYVVFQGDDHATSDPDLHEEFSVDGSVVLSNDSEIVFSPLSGTSTGSSIKIENASKAYLIEINSEGGIDW